jgi:hypothetical protein
MVKPVWQDDTINESAALLVFRYNCAMKFVRKVFGILYSKIPDGEDISTFGDKTQLQQETQRLEISEEFKQEVQGFIEQYREALEALARK